eukprot:15374400-Heterocapsa_arctica.AAC.1
MDLLGSLDYYEGETRKEQNQKKKEAFKERTMDMEVIVAQMEMGNICIKFQNVDDYHRRKE